jgi:hypothetical protein
LVEPVLSELEPAPEGVLLPGLELPPLPASPPEPGSAVPLVLAPLVPFGFADVWVLCCFCADDVEALSLEVALVAATTGSESTHVSPAIARA